MKLDGWPLAFGADDFDVAPADAVIPPRAEGFHARFFGGKSSGVTFEASGFGFAIADFTFGEDSVKETIAETGDGRADARDFGDVDAGAYDHLCIVDRGQ